MNSSSLVFNMGERGNAVFAFSTRSPLVFAYLNHRQVVYDYSNWDQTRALGVTREVFASVSYHYIKLRERSVETPGVDREPVVLSGSSLVG